MARPGDVVAERRRRPGPAEDGPRVTNPNCHILCVLDHELEVFRGDPIDDLDRPGDVVDEDHVPGCCQRGLDVPPTGRGPGDGRDLGLDGVGDRLVPGDQPGQPIRTVLRLRHHVDGRELDGACATTSMAANSTVAEASAMTTTSEGPAKAAGTPTRPATSRLARAT